MNTPLNQLPNPTDEMRHEMLMNSLEQAERPEDYKYILKHLSPPPDITEYAAPGELCGVKIGILGGGLSGSCAAFELRKLGADITIFDAAHRIGGRVYTCYFDKAGRYYGEFGAARIPVTHETSWYYMNLFGLNTLSLTSPVRNNFRYVHNVRLRTADSIEEYLYPLYHLTPAEQNTSWPNLLDYAFEYRFRQLSPDIRSQLIRILPQYSPEFLPLMSMSLRQNFEELGLSQGAINLISAADPGNGALLHISYDEVAQEEYSFDYSNTYRMEGGNALLPLAFYHSFHAKYPPQYCGLPPDSLGTVSYKAGYAVTGIYQSGYRNKLVVKYTDNTNSHASADIFDYVICTLPLSVLREIEIRPYFSNMKMQAILELNYLDAMKSLFLCSRRFWERNTDYGGILGGISYTDLPIQSIIYPGDHNQCAYLNTRGADSCTDRNTGPACSWEEPGVLTASYNLAQNSVRLGGLPPARRYDVIQQNVEEVHGLPRGFLNTVVEQHKTAHWNSEPLHRGAFACSLPEQKRLFAYELLQPEYNGRLYLAGEHASTKHGWIQGALYSGKSAANRLAQHYHDQFLQQGINNK